MILRKYLFKDILIELNEPYFKLELYFDYEFLKYANIFEVLDYYNIFKFNKPLFILNLYNDYEKTIDYLIDLAYKYNNTQQILLIIYSYIMSYYLNINKYDYYAYEQKLLTRFNIKKDEYLFTSSQLELSVIEEQYLDQFIRTFAKYPKIDLYYEKSTKNCSLYYRLLIRNDNKLKDKIKNKLKYRITNSLTLDENDYLLLKEQILTEIKKVNKKLKYR